MNSRMPNLRHLRAFGAVVRCRSISKASEVVHLSQPAVTQAIANLEDRLGVPLFERRSDGMVPTEAGALFLERVDRALALIQSGARTAVQLAARKGGRGNAKFDQLLTAAQLRALIAVSKAENFSLAARQAGISQPTVHRAARDIERLSGLSLFTKSSQGIALTPSADALAQAAKLAFAELEQGFAEIDEMLGVDAGRIVIGTLPLPRTFILPTAINALLARRPDVRVSVVDGPYNDLLRDLRHGDVDLLVGALRDPVPIDDVVQEALFSDPLAVVGRAGHPLANRPDIGLADLAAYPWVVPRQGTPTRKMFDRLFEGGTPPACPVESSSLVLIRGLLMESDHLTLISAHQIRQEERGGVLAPLPFDMSATSRPIGITHRRDWRPTATQRDFLDCVRQAGRTVALA
ncbi:MAG: LysR family transcriptional regulator [Rhodospirillaceae bacterium]|nr:LysR family transcriptional regulator [Rhodospirillaceae bacterium]